MACPMRLVVFVISVLVAAIAYVVLCFTSQEEEATSKRDKDTKYTVKQFLSDTGDMFTGRYLYNVAGAVARSRAGQGRSG